MSRSYQVVGHRGFPEKYPENSLPGILAAVEAGARYVELDVQISRDGVPMVFHDEPLARVAQRDGNVWDYTAGELTEISVHEPERFGTQFYPTPMSTLKNVCSAIQDSSVTLFVEIKAKSLEHISRELMLEGVVAATKDFAGKIILISFDTEILEMAKSYFPIGLVLFAMEAEDKATAEELNPQFLIYDVKKCAEDHQFWRGDWQWFIYDIVEPAKAQLWADRGVDFIETWDVSALLTTGV